ncbi:MAG TPA: ankyrin repeat domain-containing protein [Pyrinomonadaceae bacterium]|nr:ankyrin repeat domain-containing protein [Pyrinomonadaceae bacterium]
MNFATFPIGCVLTVAFVVSVATQQPSPRLPKPPAQSVPKKDMNAGRDFYCPSKEQRGSFCLGEDLKAVEKRGCTQLMRAAESGNIDQVRFLLKRGADANAAWPQSGITALMIAAGEGHLEVVKALLNAGANPKAMAYGHGGIPICAWMYAMNRCNDDWLEIMDALLAAGVEVNPKTIYPSPLAQAIENDDTVMIEALLKRGANVNLSDSETRDTLLIFAARYSTPEVVKSLLDAGADVTAKNKEGKTALAIAKESKDNLGRDEIVALLRQKGTKQ